SRYPAPGDVSLRDRDRARTLGGERLEMREGVTRAEPLELADVRPDPSHDATALRLTPAERGERLLALDRVLLDVGGEAVQAVADVDVVMHPHGRSGHPGRRDVAEAARRLRPRLGEAPEHHGNVTAHVDLLERGELRVGKADRIGVAPIDRVRG